MKRSFEYDAFGPWIYRIEGPHTMPPLFEPYEKETEGAIMRFKVPREIERRDADPSMNLYDRVVCIFAGEIVLLERAVKGRAESAVLTRLPLKKITCIRRTNCLLSGLLSLIIPEGTVDIPFNAVSEEIVGDAVRLIRENMPSRITESGLPPLPYDRKNMELPYLNMAMKTEKEDSSLNLIASQKSIRYRIPRLFSFSPLNRLGLTEEITSGFIILSNGRELVSVQKTYRTSMPSSECYSYEYNYIPLSSLKSIESRPLSGDRRELLLKTEHTAAALPYEGRNGSVEALLSGLIHVPEERTV